MFSTLTAAKIVTLVMALGAPLPQDSSSPTAYIGKDIEGISKALEAEPKNIGVRLRLVRAILEAVPDAEIRQARKLLETAHEQMQRIKELEPGFMYPYRVIGEVHFKKREWKDYLRTIDEYTALGRPDHEMRKMYVKSLLRLASAGGADADTRKKEAAEYVGQWLDSGMAPPFGTTLGALRAWLLDAEFRAELLAMFERRYTKDPKNLNLVISYAACLRALGRNESAWKLVHEAEKVGLCDAATGSRHQVAYLLELECPEDEGPEFYNGVDRAEMKKLAEAHPENMSLSLRYALLLKSRAFLHSRAAQLNRRKLDLVLEKRPDFPQKDKALAQIRKDEAEAKKFYAEALPWAEKVYEVNRRIEAVPLLLGDIHYRLGNHDKAIGYFEEGVKLLPDFVDLREGLALVYKDQKNWQKAAEQLLVVCKRIPLTATDWDFAAKDSLLPKPKKTHEKMIVDLLDDPAGKKAVIDVFTKACTDDPKNPSIPTYLAMIHYFAGNKADAYKWMRDAERLGSVGDGGSEHALATEIAGRTW